MYVRKIHRPTLHNYVCLSAPQLPAGEANADEDRQTDDSMMPIADRIDQLTNQITLSACGQGDVTDGV